MTWKARWVVKAITWKIISLIWGVAVVHWLTGESKLGGAYLLWYGIPSTFAFVLHEKLYHMWKAARRPPERPSPMPITLTINEHTYELKELAR